MNVDKPIPAKIVLSLKNDDGYDLFIGFSNALYNQNLIYSEPRELRKVDDLLELIVIFRDKASFTNWISNSNIQKYWSGKFESLLTRLPETIEEVDVIVEVDKVENCQCDSADFYILQGRSLQFSDELTCSNCLKQVSYARIPVEINIESWQNYHQRFYLNWLDSGVFEQDAYKELTNYKEGKLNQQGELIRSELSDYFKVPVYLSYFVEEPDENHSCLICGYEGEHSGLNRPSKICKKCNTIFD